MEMYMGIPTLTEIIVESPKSNKPEIVFYITFFKAELKRQTLENRGYIVSRKIDFDSNNEVIVIYNFPEMGDKRIEKSITLSISDPFSTRVELLNQLDSIISVSMQMQKIQEALTVIKNSLTTSQLDAINRLSDEELIAAIKNKQKI